MCPAPDEPTHKGEVMKEKHPIGSVDRLKELNLNLAIYPSCGEFIQRNVQGRGRVTEQKGCKYFHECEWRNNTKWMQARDEKDIKPRPRNVKTRFVKPDPDGPGDVIIDNYCLCTRWHENLKRRHKKNRELAKVIGGEGDKVNIRVHHRVERPDKSVVFEQDYKEVTIPRFPDPTENKDLRQDVFAAKAKAEVEGADDSVDDARRLGIQPDLGAGTEFSEMSIEDAKAIAGGKSG